MSEARDAQPGPGAPGDDGGGPGPFPTTMAGGEMHSLPARTPPRRDSDPAYARTECIVPAESPDPAPCTASSFMSRSSTAG